MAIHCFVIYAHVNGGTDVNQQCPRSVAGHGQLDWINTHQFNENGFIQIVLLLQLIRLFHYRILLFHYRSDG